MSLAQIQNGGGERERERKWDSVSLGLAIGFMSFSSCLFGMKLGLPDVCLFVNQIMHARKGLLRIGTYAQNK